MHQRLAQTLNLNTQNLHNSPILTHYLVFHFFSTCHLGRTPFSGSPFHFC